MSRLAISGQPKVNVLHVGDEGCPVVVVDDFAKDPDRWRAEAIGGDWAVRGDFYPGRRRPVDPAYFDDVGQTVAAILRRAFGCSRRISVDRALYSIVSTPPEELALAQRIPHIDDVAINRFAMVHYLSHDNFGGTAFFRHKETAFAVVSPDRHRAYLLALERQFATDKLPGAGYIAGDTDAFEQCAVVEFRFNRVVIYPGNLLHCSVVSPHIDHADDPQCGRLTIASFLTAE